MRARHIHRHIHTHEAAGRPLRWDSSGVTALPARRLDLTAIAAIRPSRLQRMTIIWRRGSESNRRPRLCRRPGIVAGQGVLRLATQLTTAKGVAAALPRLPRNSSRPPSPARPVFARGVGNQSTGTLHRARRTGSWGNRQDRRPEQQRPAQGRESQEGFQPLLELGPFVTRSEAAISCLSRPCMWSRRYPCCCPHRRTRCTSP